MLASISSWESLSSAINSSSGNSERYGCVKVCPATSWPSEATVRHMLQLVPAQLRLSVIKNSVPLIFRGLNTFNATLGCDQ